MSKIGLLITILLTGTVVAGALCSAAITYERNASRGIPTELIEKNQAIQEKYKEIAERNVPIFLNPFTPVQTTPTATATQTRTITPLPTESSAPVSTAVTPTPTSNESAAHGDGKGWDQATGAFFSTLLILVLVAVCGFLFLVVRSRETAVPGNTTPWWGPWRTAVAASHALVAAIFFLESLSFVASGIPGSISSGQGSVWIITGGFLLVYGAISSAGIAYSSFCTLEPKMGVIMHTAILGAGLTVFGAFLIVPVIPSPSPVPPAIFLAGLFLIAIQAYVPWQRPRQQATAYTDTMLFEYAPAESVHSFPPELASRYSDARFLHQGGIARVFSARRRDDGVMVAVKVPIRTDEQTGRSMLREMSVWRTLVHPGIVRVNAANILPVPFVEMEYLPGSLDGITLPMDPDDAASLVGKVAAALSFAHGRGVIHRDLKPGNILLTPEGEPKIGDWGLSQNDGVPSETTLHGFSLAYAAPEQLDPGRFGRTTEKTDIYQLGIIFFRLLTGMLPFPGESIAEVAKERLSGREEPFFADDPCLFMFGAVIGRCLAVDPDKRYPSLQEFVNDLEAARRKYLASRNVPSGGDKEHGNGPADR